MKRLLNPRPASGANADPPFRLSFWRSWFAPLFCLILLVSVGSIGYMSIEDLSLLDALYLTVVTLATIGVHEALSPIGKVFTIGLIVFGVGTGAWLARAMIEAIWHEESRERRRLRKMQKQIEELSGHFIVCGYGRIGREVARFFARRHISTVVIDSDPERVRVIEADACLLVPGNAHDDAVLRAAGIERAKGLIATVGSDSENIFIVLSARGLNPNLFIVARSSYGEDVSKLQRAGANRVISPSLTGGRSIAAAAAHPAVSAFLDLVTDSERSEIELMELTVPPGSGLAGKALKDLDIYGRTGAVILAKHSADGKVVPPSMIDAGDTLVAVGTMEQLERLQGML